MPILIESSDPGVDTTIWDKAKNEINPIHVFHSPVFNIKFYKDINRKIAHNENEEYVCVKIIKESKKVFYDPSNPNLFREYDVVYEPEWLNNLVVGQISETTVNSFLADSDKDNVLIFCLRKFLYNKMVNEANKFPSTSSFLGYWLNFITHKNISTGKLHVFFYLQRMTVTSPFPQALTGIQKNILMQEVKSKISNKNSNEFINSSEGIVYFQTLACGSHIPPLE